MTSPLTLRVATFNVAFARARPAQLAADLAAGHPQVQRVSKIIQHIRPDILLLNEFDHDGVKKDDQHLTFFCEHYLGSGSEAIDYPYRYMVPTNTGLLAPLSLQGHAVARLPQDGLGFGAFHGQYAMAVVSRYPLLLEQLRSFRHFLWQDMPNACLPTTAAGPYYQDDMLDILPLSSKNHLDLPVQLPQGRVIHLLAAHPAPPIDEGVERRNSCRNHDELRLWHDYIGVHRADYLVDDVGVSGGLDTDKDFIIVGDLNADPQDGDGFRSAIQGLLNAPQLNREVALGRLRPASRGGFSLRGKGAHRGSPRFWTHQQGLRLDYVLPSASLTAVSSGVYWPQPHQLHAEWFWNKNGWPARKQSSDHRLVWVDIRL